MKIRNKKAWTKRERKENRKAFPVIYQALFTLLSKSSLSNCSSRSTLERWGTTQQQNESKRVNFLPKKVDEWETAGQRKTDDIERVQEGSKRNPERWRRWKGEQRAWQRETIKQLDRAACSGVLRSAIYARINQKLLEHGEHLNFRHLSIEKRREGEKERS